MSKYLEDVKKFIEEKNYNCYSIAEMKDGREPEEVQIVPGNPCQNSYSMAKAFVVLAIGMMYDRKLLTVDSKLTHLLGDECPKNYDKKWDEVTVHHLLTHTAGLRGGCLDIDCIDAREFGEDYLEYMFNLPFEHEIGVERFYSDGAFYLLARIVEKLTGENLLNFMWHEFFFKTGAREVAWSCCPKGHSIGASGLYIRSVDAVKLGEVFRTGGLYQGQRIVSEEWVKMCLEEPAYEMSSQGIGNLYGKGGMECQKLFVDPDKNRVVCLHAFRNTDCDEIMKFTAEYKD